jgi:hypothetical protein
MRVHDLERKGDSMKGKTQVSEQIIQKLRPYRTELSDRGGTLRLRFHVAARQPLLTIPK